jgi:hypothetical protein
VDGDAVMDGISRDFRGREEGKERESGEGRRD